MTIVLLILLFLVALPLFWAVSTYTQFKALRRRAGLALAQLDQHAKRRYMLVPSLVDTVRRPMANEATTLDDVLVSRSAAVAANRMVGAGGDASAALANWSRAEGALSNALLHLLESMANYPDVKTHHDAAQLIGELMSTSKKIGFGAQGYNQAVMLYNAAIADSPARLVARVFKFRRAELLDANV